GARRGGPRRARAGDARESFAEPGAVQGVRRRRARDAGPAVRARRAQRADRLRRGAPGSAAALALRSPGGGRGPPGRAGGGGRGHAQEGLRLGRPGDYRLSGEATPPDRRVADALRAAVERTLAATAGSAAMTRDRATELLDEVARRGREAG